MQKLTRRQIGYSSTIVLLLLAAAWLELRGFQHAPPPLSMLLRVCIHAGLLLAWAVSLQRRILQSKVRVYLTVIAALLLFWLIERFFKYELPNSCTAAIRYLWYLYYVPMELVPLLGVFTALCMGRGERYNPPKRVRLLYLPAFVMIALVLTNDLHQLAFRFPDGVLNRGDSYAYGPFYYLAAGWILLETLAFLVILWEKNRIPGKKGRMLLPLLPTTLGVVYCVIYVVDYPLVRVFAGDLTAVLCLVMVATFEACIQARLIASNTHYRQLFRASTIAAQITDEDLRVLLSSDAARSIPPQALRRAVEAPCLLPQGLRLSGAPIRKGYVIWQEDVSELLGILEELEDVDDYLKGRQKTAQQEYETSRRQSRLAEQNRLYNKLLNQTQPDILLFSQLVEQLEQAQTPERARFLASRIALLSAYLKRRDNLIFLAEEQSRISTSELVYCIRESLSNLQLCGVNCGCTDALDGTLRFEEITWLYETFHRLVMQAVDTLRSLYVYLIMRDSRPTVTMNLVCGPVFEPMDNVELQQDDGEWSLTFAIPEGGVSL